MEKCSLRRKGLGTVMDHGVRQEVRWILGQIEMSQQEVQSKDEMSTCVSGVGHRAGSSAMVPGESQPGAQGYQPHMVCYSSGSLMPSQPSSSSGAMRRVR
jgi:hypothetical protein